MDELHNILTQITNELNSLGKPNNLVGALEQETTLAYLYYSLCICEQKLTNNLDKKTIESIKALKSNFKLCKEKNKEEIDQEEQEYINKMYN